MPKLQSLDELAEIGLAKRAISNRSISFDKAVKLLGISKLELFELLRLNIIPQRKDVSRKGIFFKLGDLIEWKNKKKVEGKK